MSKAEHHDLTQGSILQKLVRLALPIMGSQFVQMAYNLADMFWLGRLGSGAVAASGTVGIYMWLSMALQHYGARGAEIGVSQSIGRREYDSARGYAQSALGLSSVLGVAFGAILVLFRGPLVGFFAIREAQVVQDATAYLSIVSIGIPFTYITATAVGAFNGSGNSTTPFYINCACLILNIILDPLLIFTAGMGIRGAAVATVVAQVLACVLMLAALQRYRHPALQGLRLLAPLRRQHLATIFRWATPIAVESFFFTFLSMIITRFVAGFGAGAMAAQRIGTQVESLSWLIAGGFSSAFTAYVGQNFGASAFGRIRRGFSISTAAMTAWGLAITGILFFGARGIFTLFLPGEPDVIEMGVQYLRILASCQLLACYEGIAAGAFRGMGKTLPPSIISISCNAARVVLAWVLCRGPMGINGIWWAIALGGAARGGVLMLCYLIYARRMPHCTLPADT